LDRDGVLVEDVGLVTDPSQFVICSGVPHALRRLKSAGYLLFVVTNQAVVARGFLSELDLGKIHRDLETLLLESGAPVMDGIYACPHHPQATLAEYRMDCFCRKPRPGLLLEAAKAHGIDLARSYMVGDRLTDVHAGIRAGCKSVWVQTGRHVDPLIQTVDPLEEEGEASHVCADLSAAVHWILSDARENLAPVVTGGGG
jgi:D-glycero-D-manno-heptose 1,7-bisphosphate phosphatase